MPGFGKRFVSVAARAAFERMMRHNPAFSELQELRFSLRPHRKMIERSEAGRLHNHVIEMVLKAMEEGEVRSRADVDSMLKQISEDLEGKGHNVNLKFDTVFPGHYGRSVESYFTVTHGPRRGPLR